MRLAASMLLIAMLQASAASAATTIVPGGPFRTLADVPRDGLPTYVYNFASGELRIEGEGTGIGLVDAQSASGLFTDRWTCSGCFPINTDFRYSVLINGGTGVTVPSLRLFNIEHGLMANFLQQDFTLEWSGGFGHPIREADLAIIGVPEPASLSLAAAMIAFASRRRRQIGGQIMRIFAWALLLAIATAPLASAATTIVPGSPFRTLADVPRDGAPTYHYFARTGEFHFDGEDIGIHNLDAQSTAGLFQDRTLPQGLFPVSTPQRMSVVVAAGTGQPIPSARLANLGRSRPIDFLQEDLTLLWFQGFGGPNVVADLSIIGIPEPAAWGLAVVALGAWGVCGCRRLREHPSPLINANQ